MVDIMVRDLALEVASSIDARAKAAKLSRQQFLTQHLHRTFGPDGSSTAAIAGRLRSVFGYLAQLSIGFELKTATVPVVAELLGFSTPMELESFIQGDTPLSFEVADRLCDILGIYREWLLNGRLNPYHQKPRFTNIEECFKALALGDIQTDSGHTYEKWIFLMSSDKRGSAAVYGYTSESSFRCDLILRDIPMGAHVGGGGASDIMQFAWLCAAIDSSLTGGPVIPVKFNTVGRIEDRLSFDSYTNGESHPAGLTCIGNPHFPWYQDIWDLSYQGDGYTPGFVGARKVFQDGCEWKGHEGLKAYLGERVDQIRRYAGFTSDKLLSK